MQEPDRERQLEPDPREPELDEEQQEEQAMATEPPFSDAGGDPDEQEDQPEEDHEVSEAGVEAEAVHEGVVVDRRTLVVELVRGVERPVARQTDQIGRAS